METVKTCQTGAAIDLSIAVLTVPHAPRTDSSDAVSNATLSRTVAAHLRTSAGLNPPRGCIGWFSADLSRTGTFDPGRASKRLTDRIPT